MPSKPKRTCSYPGCGEMVSGGRCEKHKRQEQKRYDERRGTSTERGYNATWGKLRRMYLSQHPLCERCEDAGMVVSAVMVHHKQRIAEGGAVLDTDNLMSVCRPCHDELHKEHVFKTK